VRSAATQSTPAPCANPLGLPRTSRCVDRRKFSFRLHGRRVVEVAIYVDDRRIVRRRARRIASVTLRRLPQRRFTVKVVARRAGGRTLVTVRRYRGCRKGRPKGHSARHT
jgi:hypothetical protein